MSKKNQIILIIIIGIIIFGVFAYYFISTSTPEVFYHYYISYADLIELTENDKGKKISVSGVVTRESDNTFYIDVQKDTLHITENVKSAVHITYDENTKFVNDLLDDEIEILDTSISDNSFVSIDGTYNYTSNGIIYISADKVTE